MKHFNYTIFNVLLLVTIYLSIASAQEVKEWDAFIDSNLNSTSELIWIESNGTLDYDINWISFQTSQRVEQPILSGTTNVHHLELTSEQEQALSEKTIRISVSAKQPEQNAARSFAIAYSTNDSGNSGWRNFRATPDWNDYSFTFTVPKLNEGKGDYLGIAGDFYGTNKATQIRSLKIEILQSATEEVQETYTVQAGDSLSQIAKTVYGDGTLWLELFEANQDSLDNPNVLSVGTELIIPKR